MKHVNKLAIFSLVYGGFLLLTYLVLAYFVLWRGEFPPILMNRRPPRGLAFEPLSELLSTNNVLLFISGIAFIVNGYVLLKYDKAIERGKARDFFTSKLLTEDEKKVYGELVKMNGEATQKELTVRLGLSPVKIHRILYRLEQKSVIKTYQFGMTKKIVIDDADNPADKQESRQKNKQQL